MCRAVWGLDLGAKHFAPGKSRETGVWHLQVNG